MTWVDAKRRLLDTLSIACKSISIHCVWPLSVFLYVCPSFADCFSVTCLSTWLSFCRATVNLSVYISVFRQSPVCLTVTGFCLPLRYLLFCLWLIYISDVCISAAIVYLSHVCLFIATLYVCLSVTCLFVCRLSVYLSVVCRLSVSLFVTCLCDRPSFLFWVCFVPVCFATCLFVCHSVHTWIFCLLFAYLSLWRRFVYLPIAFLSISQCLSLILSVSYLPSLIRLYIACLFVSHLTVSLSVWMSPNHLKFT